MSIKLNLGVNKKIGEPNYGSRGASCHVEFELDGSLDNGTAARFQEAARRAYAACRHVVESELAAGDSHSQLRTTGHTNAPTARKDQWDSVDPVANRVRMATEGQVRAIRDSRPSPG